MPPLSPQTRVLRLPFRTKPVNKNKHRTCVIQDFFNLCSQGHLHQAVQSLPLLARKGLRLDSPSIGFLLQECAKSRSFREGKWIHLHLKLTGFKHPSTFLVNHLINMYCQCGKHVEARGLFDKMSCRNLYSWNNMLSGYAKLGMIKPAMKLFDEMPQKDVVSWNTIVIAHAKSGYSNEAFRLFKELRRSSIWLNAFSFAGILTVCVQLKALRLTRQVHCQVFLSGFLWNVVLSSSIVDAYSKCGEMLDAKRLFDEMPIKDILAWTTLVSGYAQWGDMISASIMFDSMPEKNPVSWTSMISGYARNGMGHEALTLFSKMMISHANPDQFTFSSSLCACASIASLKHGKQIHACLIRSGFKPNTIVISSLIDMYSKCGNLDVGQRVFNIMGNKHDVVLWNTMISALAHHGYGEEAIQMLTNMVKLGVKTDRVTFVVLLNACSHSGLVEEGLRLFDSMLSDHKINPDSEHYACLIDLLGRAGHFDEVLYRLKKMPFKPDNSVWNSLLGVCRIHGNIELGKKAAEQLIELEPQSSAAYVLLSSIYASLGKWESVEKVRQLMNERLVRKERAVSWLEIENKMHSFTVSDRLHSSKQEIYSILDLLASQVVEDEESLHDAERLLRPYTMGVSHNSSCFSFSDR